MIAERPRDILGRPLPHDADPALIVPGVPASLELTDDAAWELAMDYREQGMPFHMHEVFELRWRQCPRQHRDAWQALAQWGAALTHEARGNAKGARAVAARARTLLARSAAPPCVNKPLVTQSLNELAELKG